MAKSNAVWGIDIGNASLKALRCRPGEEPSQIIADAFDYIEYPKILTQPGTASRRELVNEAASNSCRGTMFAATAWRSRYRARTDWPGLSSYRRSESKKIPDIVRYEARSRSRSI